VPLALLALRGKLGKARQVADGIEHAVLRKRCSPPAGIAVIIAEAACTLVAPACNNGSMSTEVNTAPTLPRVLGASHATAIVVGTIIGSGIFLVPREMMQAAGSAGLVYLAWIAGGLLTLFGALTYAELGAARPQAGGEYVYLRDAYGELAAFLYMWTWFAVAKPASIAALTTGLVRILGTFRYLDFLQLPVPGLPLQWAQVAAICFAWLISGLNYLGVKKAGDFQLAFTWLKGVLILAIVGFCAFGGQGSAVNFSALLPGATGGLAGFMVALIATLWAYDGWNDLSMVAGEVRNPQRSLPFALIAGVAIVGLLYMATNAAILYVLPPADTAASPRPAVEAMARVAGPLGAGFVSAAMALSILVTLNGTILSGARIPFAAARDGLFFKGMATIHPRFHSPSTAIVVQALLSSALLLVSSRFQQLFELAIFAEWLFYLLTASTVFVFRRRIGEMPSPFRMPGYPLLPAVFVLVAAAVLVYTYGSNWQHSLIGTALILAGIPLYFFFKRRSGARRNPGTL
jgi:APA family basic amino acid/polyamine antiporter